MGLLDWIRIKVEKAIRSLGAWYECMRVKVD